MKKIVGILAAAALAASVFAVDFTAGMQLKGELLNVDNSTDVATNATATDVKAMILNSKNSKDDKPFIFSLNTDRVGGQLKIFHDGTGTFKDAAYQIWFKPFDMLKVDLGNFSWAMNTETITYWEGKVLGTSDWGWRATATFDAFELGAGIFAKDNVAWLTANQGSDATVGETAVWAQYSADFGTLKFLGKFESTFKKDSFAIGYNNKFGDLSIFTDAAIILDNSVAGTSTTALNADFDIAYAKDAISVQAYALLGIANFNNVKPTLMTKFKAAYALNGGSLYFKFQDGNIMADSFAANFEVGYDGNLGAMAYNVAAKIDLGGVDKNDAGVVTKKHPVVFSVPVWFRLSF